MDLLSAVAAERNLPQTGINKTEFYREKKQAMQKLKTAQFEIVLKYKYLNS